MRLLRTLAMVSLAAMTVARADRPALAAPSGEFVRARAAFQRGDYSRAIPLLSYLLYPSPRLSDRAELAEAHLLLGVAYFETGNQPDAGDEFDKALREDDSLRLDPLFVSKDAVAFFEKRRAAFEKRRADDAVARGLAEENAAYRRAIENMVVIEKRPYYVNFIPFGAGQYQNGNNGMGLFFSLSQAVTGGASAAIFSFHAVKYGFGGRVPRTDNSDVRLLQKAQIGAGAACLGLMAWGIIDSLMNYKPTIQRQPDESLLPEELKRKRRPGTGSLRLTPAPLDGGGALLLQWGF